MPEISEGLRKFLGAGLSEDGMSFTAQFGKEVSSGAEKITSVTVYEPVVAHLEETAKFQNLGESKRKLISLCSSPPVSPETVRFLPISEFRRVDAFLENFMRGPPETSGS